MDRRQTLKLLAVGAVGASVPGCGPSDVERAAEAVGATEVDGSFVVYTRRFFSDPEFHAVRVLAETIIPADERSGSATDARVPEFIDFIADDRPELQTRLRGGLAWLNYRCARSFGRGLTDLTREERLQILDAIAWPEQAEAADAPGVAFFTLMRDLTAAGFFSSRMGMEDVGYVGNVARPEWTGCGEAAMRHVGA